MIAVQQSRFNGSESTNRRMHGGGSDAGDVVAKQLRYFLWVLVGNQAEADFGNGAGRDNTFGPVAVVAAGHAIQRERRTDGRSFIKTEAGFSPSPFHLSILQNFMVGGAGAPHQHPLLFPPIPYVIAN